MSETGKIYEAMASVCAQIGAIDKNRDGHGYKYRGVQDVLDEAHALLAAAKITVMLDVREPGVTFQDVQRGSKTWKHAAAVIGVRFVHQDGSSVTSWVPAEGEDNMDKASNKMIANALKYALFTAFTVPYSGEGGLRDSEADDTGEPARRPQKSNRDRLWEEVKARGLEPKQVGAWLESLFGTDPKKLTDEQFGKALDAIDNAEGLEKEAA